MAAFVALLMAAGLGDTKQDEADQRLWNIPGGCRFRIDIASAAIADRR